MLHCASLSSLWPDGEILERASIPDGVQGCVVMIDWQSSLTVGMHRCTQQGCLGIAIERGKGYNRLLRELERLYTGAAGEP